MIACTHFQEVLSALEEGRADYAILPMENSTYGMVQDNFDLLAKHPKLYVVQEIEFPVSHCLATLPGESFSDIKRVYSHPQALSQCAISDAVRDYVITPVIEESGLALATGSMKTLINPSGRFVLGGPAADAGLTGRKIIVDTYGGMARHGGGAFSGKDPSKVDRSATYAARWVAKNVVAAGIAQRCEIQLAYAIGRARPIGLYVDTFGTASVPEERIADAIREVFDLRPLGMIEDLDLLRPIYRETAAYGHFGREQFPWEATNRVDQLKAALA